MKLNEKIIVCRRRAGLSQEGLAEQLGVSRQAVSRWECGDAVPEPAKILLLAKTFGVTTDWLLDDTLGTPEPEAQSHAQTLDSEPSVPPTQTTSAAHPGWIDSLPGVIGRFLRRWGWLAGVYIMCIGLLFVGIGGAGRLMFSTVLHNFSAPTYGISSSIVIRDESGNDITNEMPPELFQQIYDEFDVSPASPYTATRFEPGLAIVMIVPNLILTLGVIIMLVGAAVAVALWRVGRGEKEA